MKKLDIYTDGASSGNPGLAGIGVVFLEDEKPLKEISRPIGTTTNNVAEYMALIAGLQEAYELKADTVTIYTDSELMYKQCLGEYKVKNANIKPLYDQAQQLAKHLQRVIIKYIPREKNKQADKLAKQACRGEQTKVVASKTFFGEESPSSKG